MVWLDEISAVNLGYVHINLHQKSLQIIEVPSGQSAGKGLLFMVFGGLAGMGG